MRLTWQKIKLFLAMVCIGAMAFFTGVPIIPQEKVAKILSANNRHLEAKVIETDCEQS